MLVPGFDSDLNKRLADLRRRDNEPVAAAEVAQIVEGVVRALYNANNGSTFDLKMFGEIESLFRFIQKAKSEIAALRPDKINDEQIPLATDELDAVIRATETATATILDEAEKLDRLATAIGGAPATEIGRSVTQIYEACSFRTSPGSGLPRSSPLFATSRNGSTESSRPSVKSLASCRLPRSCRWRRPRPDRASRSGRTRTC